MSALLTFAPGWNLDVPAGTYVIRADVVMNRRPGAGGWCAILEASDIKETVILRGCIHETTTETVAKVMASRLAGLIGSNRAVVVTRSVPIQRIVAEAFKPFKMIRMLGNSPLAVSDATRNAAVMAERAENQKRDSDEILRVSRYEADENYAENQDSGTIHSAFKHLIKVVADTDVRNPEVRKAAQDMLDAAERSSHARYRQALKGITANDMPKPTIERGDP